MKKAISILLLAALLLGLCPAVQAQEAGSFFLTAVTDSKVLVEPEAVAYQPGQTIAQALLASNHTFTGLEQGFIQAVDGESGNFYLLYDGAQYKLDAPASQATTLLLTTVETPWSESLQQLLLRMGEFRTMTGGVQQYEPAQQRYRSCLTALRQASGFDQALAELNQAIAEFESLMNGPKYPVRFQVTQGAAAAQNVQITLTGIYGDQYTAQGTSLEVIPGSYRFCVSDGSVNRTEGTVEVNEQGAQVAVTLPSGKWFGDVSILRNSSEREPYPRRQLDDYRAQFFVPDIDGPHMINFSQRGPDAPEGTRLFHRFAGKRESAVWNNKYNTMFQVIQTGMQGCTVMLEAEYKAADGYAQIQSFAAELIRTPTLRNLTVLSDGAEAYLGFAPLVSAYQIRVASDKLTVHAEPLSSDYTVAVNGQVLSGDTEIDARDFTVTVTAGEQSQTYQVSVKKLEPVYVTVRHDADVAVEVRNQADASIPAVRTDTYRLVPGESYTYIATKGGEYHAAAAFTAEQDLTVTAATPVAQPWLTKLQLAAAGYPQAPVEEAYEIEPAFTPENHDYRVPVSDCSLAVYVWTDTPEDGVEISGHYPEFLTGKARRLSIQSGSQRGSYMPSMLSYSGIGNDLTIRAEKTDGDVTYYQEYRVEIYRTLHVYEMTASSEGAPVTLEPEFDRDCTEYTAQVPQGAENITLNLEYPHENEVRPCGYYMDVVCGSQQTRLEFVRDALLPVELALDPLQKTETITVTVGCQDSAAKPGQYTIRLEKLPPVTAKFQVEPAEASILVVSELSGQRAWPDDTGAFILMQSHSYRYTLTCPGYVAKTGTFTADGDQVIAQTLTKAPVNGNLNPDLEALWPDFRGNRDNNGVTDAPTPIRDEEAVLYWATKLGEGYSAGATGCPILACGSLYTYAGTDIYRMDPFTGEILAQAPMDHASSFAINNPTYAEGMIFVGLSNGCIQAFDAQTLQSLWLYQDALGGQPNCPIVYHGGYLYTGFWNSETGMANYVCLTVTDEDPTAEKEAKVASWTHTSQGGFYWAGACVRDGFLLVGTDDGETGYTTGYASIVSLDTRSGKVIDSITLPRVGDQRSAISYDAQTDSYYFTTKGGQFYTVQTAQDGTFRPNSLRYLDLNNGSNSAATPAMSTSTPVVYNGRAYVGVSGVGQFSPYSGHNITVIDLKNWEIAYSLPTQGYPQTSGLLTTAYEGEEEIVYVYFLDNFTPGKLRLLEDRPGQNKGSLTVTEIYQENGVEKRAETPYVLFTPSGDQEQYAICSPIVDEYGTLYFKNDSAYMMAVGSTIERLEVKKLPQKLRYQVGEVFDPTGMQVVATYTNGMTRDVTNDITFTTEPLTAEDTELQIRFERVQYQNRDGKTGVVYTAPQTSLDLRFGEASADEKAAEETERLIEAIGTVTLESKEAIDAARASYDSLTDAQKALVRNYQTLLDAEAAYEALLKTDDEKAAEETERLIDAIGTVTLESKAAIEAARASYDSLTDAQKALVRNYQTLLDAEAAYEALLHTHAFGPWASNQDGTHSRTCACGETETEPCECVRETVREATCTEAGLIREVCPVCQWEKQEEAIPALGHDWGKWENEQPGDCFTPGSQVRQCARCGETEERSTEKNPADCPSRPFADLDTARWYHQGVDWAISSGLMNGMSATSFQPNTPLTRGQLVTILYRMAGQPTVGGKMPFRDVADGRFYTKPTLWASQKGLVKGVTETLFAPEQPITREQLMTILYRYAQLLGQDVEADGTLSGFSDWQKVSGYARKPMLWAVDRGLINGMDGALVPQGQATRAQIATILFRWTAKK